MSSVPIDRGWAWVISLAVMFNNVVMVGLINVSGLIFIEMVEQFHAPASLVSFIIGFRAAIFSVFAVIGLGIFNEFLHSRILVMVGGVMASLGFVSSFVSSHINHMFAYAIFAGAGHSLIYGPGLVMVGKYFEKRRSLANGIASSGTSLGTLIFPYIFLYLIEEFAFLGAMLICGSLCLNCCVAGSLMRPTEFYDRRPKTRHENTDDNLSVQVTPQELRLETEHKLFTNVNSKTKNDDVELIKYSPSEFIDIPLDSNTALNENSSADQKIESHVGDGPKPETCSKINNFENCKDSFENIPDQHYGTSNTKLYSDTRRMSLKLRVRSLQRQASKRAYNAFFSAAKGQRKKRLLNVALMKTPLFIVFQIASSLYMTTITIQAIYLPTYAKEDKRPLSEITILLSVLGVTDFVGRLAFGFIGDLGFIEPHKIFIIASTLIGIMACALRLFTGFWLLLVYHCIYGFLCAAYPTLMPVTLVNVFGLDNMSRSLSTTLLLKGVIQIGLSPALGYIKDQSGTFIWSFMVIGALTLVSSLLFVVAVIPLMNLDKNRKQLVSETANTTDF